MHMLQIKLLNKLSNCLTLISSVRLNNKPTIEAIQTLFLSTTIIQSICGLILLWNTNKLGLITYLIIRGLLTNWIHEDAISDCSDSSTKQNITTRLELLKQPTIGAYGCCILTSTILLEFILLSNIKINNLPTTCTICSSIGYFSMVCHWYLIPHAYNSQHYQPKLLILLTWLPLLLITILLQTNWIQTILLLMSNLLLLLTFNLWSLHKFGGHTGNTIGALKKLSEILSLFTMTN
ncbi:Adenosylcobinamide-GDP ribazoletransferase [Candidatus Hodgkinia cicadicola]|uniref:Adenosylcobinamide-GDP ribazoletransferase n=1 Tax=Candidatus Hodgkinia cicadicola TaxID=573658 RepID=A0ABX4MIV9_9HYPH|nr:Adenosylcobinamide-GDP ribazoletransferase [Candidatus Hodgkinia cicadicola]PIM95579.1 Adenosylcobinamide-GDP ribazoletransferase [Candidatus Hodgkinia cicadicola]